MLPSHYVNKCLCIKYIYYQFILNVLQEKQLQLWRCVAGSLTIVVAFVDKFMATLTCNYIHYIYTYLYMTVVEWLLLWMCNFQVWFPIYCVHVLDFVSYLPPIQIQSIWCGEDWSYEAAGCLSLPLPAAGISWTVLTLFIRTEPLRSSSTRFFPHRAVMVYGPTHSVSMRLPK